MFTFFCDNPFKTRDPEVPNTSQSAWVPPHTAEDLLANMQSAIREKNPDNYIRCYIEDAVEGRRFQFVPDPDVAIQYPYLNAWTREAESNMIKLTFSYLPADSGISLVFGESIREVVTADSVVMLKPYTFSIHHNQPELPRTLEGQAELWMTENAIGEWTIYRWQDYAAENQAPWSEWKANLGGEP